MWFKIENDQVRLRIIAKPRAKKTAILKVTEEGLYVAIHAIPCKGAANQELIIHLAKAFQLPKSKIHLASGEGSKIKIVTLPLTPHVQALLHRLGSSISMSNK